MGVDLSEFEHIEVPITAPRMWSVSQLTEWLTRCLGFNTETYTVGVHALWSRSSSNIFLLFEANRAGLSVGVLVARLCNQDSKSLRLSASCPEGGQCP